MTLTQMRYFTVLAECLNYTVAARRLFITQPSLSRQIALIEEEIGVKLLIRNNKTTRLTPVGLHVQRSFHQILEEYDSMRTRAQAIERQYTGNLRIAVIHLQATRQDLTKILSMLQHQYPNLLVELTSRGYRELLAGLGGGDFDIAITHDFEMEEHTEFRCTPIAELDNYLVVPCSHPNASLPNPSIRDFRDMDFITLDDEESPSMTRLCRASCHQAGFEPKIRTVQNYLDMCLAIEAEQGINGLNSENYLHSVPHLKFIKVPEIPNRMLVAAWHPDNKNPAVPAFVQQVRRYRKLQGTSALPGA